MGARKISFIIVGAIVAIVGAAIVLSDTYIAIKTRTPPTFGTAVIGIIFAFVGGYIMYPSFTDHLAASFTKNALPFVEVIRGGRRKTDPVVEVSAQEKQDDANLKG